MRSVRPAAVFILLTHQIFLLFHLVFSRSKWNHLKWGETIKIVPKVSSQILSEIHHSQSAYSYSCWFVVTHHFLCCISKIISSNVANTCNNVTKKKNMNWKGLTAKELGGMRVCVCVWARQFWKETLQEVCKYQKEMQSKVPTKSLYK